MELTFRTATPAERLYTANITMTLDYYTHVDACSVKAEMERLAA